MSQRCEPCSEGRHRQCERPWKCTCPLCTYQYGIQIGHAVWKAYAKRVRIERLRRFGDGLVFIDSRELAGLWRRRGDRFCAVYRIEEHVPWERDADVKRTAVRTRCG